MSYIKLKPCPLCGGEAEKNFVAGSHRKWVIICKGCGYNVILEAGNDMFSDIEAVSNKWNTRERRNRNE